MRTRRHVGQHANGADLEARIVPGTQLRQVGAHLQVLFADAAENRHVDLSLGSRRHRHSPTSAMKDLSSAFWIKVKGLLFLLLGIAAAVLLLVENLSWKNTGLLVLAIWCFCRFYYFAFYVIEKYVDPGYKFSGLIAFFRYLLTRKRG